MRLKNFSLCRPAEDYQLTPAYDLLNVAIANPKDKEKLALTLAGKKTKFRLADFLNAAKTMGLEENVVQRLVAGLHPNHFLLWLASNSMAFSSADSAS